MEVKVERWSPFDVLLGVAWMRYRFRVVKLRTHITPLPHVSLASWSAPVPSRDRAVYFT